MLTNNTILIVDFEATCESNENYLPRYKMEIIEIGAIKVSLPDFTIIDSFQRFIKPLRTPVLTNFCKQLTGITQAEVDKADIFYNVASDFFEWCWNIDEPIAWASWGMYDFHQLNQDCEHYFLDNELLLIQHLNLKNLYGDAANGRRRGLKNAALEQGSKFQGRHHRALDDALNALNIINAMPKFKKLLIKELL
ncbi:exonuclease domain-containing protein [Aeromonas veronii]|uniref:exonuclease domain-containing protein n=1 Tax=Aeromonas veronii TaxID=654 RepID=UPI003D1B09F9